jgi:nitroreductase
MNLDEAIRGRRSIREYREKSVPEELVRQVIKAATFAPSAKNGQQRRFTVLTGNAKNELTDRFRHELEILCKKIGEGNASEMGWETEKYSVAAAIQNMLLKAYSIGLGFLWIGDVFFTIEALEQHFGKPWKILAAVTLGYPAYVPEGPWNGRPRKSVDEVAEFLR